MEQINLLSRHFFYLFICVSNYFESKDGVDNSTNKCNRDEQKILTFVLDDKSLSKNRKQINGTAKQAFYLQSLWKRGHFIEITFLEYPFLAPPVKKPSRAEVGEKELFFQKLFS